MAYRVVYVVRTVFHPKHMRYKSLLFTHARLKLKEGIVARNRSLAINANVKRSVFRFIDLILSRGNCIVCCPDGLRVQCKLHLFHAFYVLRVG